MNPEGADGELERIEQKIEQLKEQSKPPEAAVATPGLVFSMGFLVIGALLMGEQIGRYLSEKAGNPQYRLVGWGLGLGLAGLAVYRLFRPYMK